MHIYIFSEDKIYKQKAFCLKILLISNFKTENYINYAFIEVKVVL